MGRDAPRLGALYLEPDPTGARPVSVDSDGRGHILGVQCPIEVDNPVIHYLDCSVRCSSECAWFLVVQPARELVKRNILYGRDRVKLSRSIIK